MGAATLCYPLATRRILVFIQSGYILVHIRKYVIVLGRGDGELGLYYLVARWPPLFSLLLLFLGLASPIRRRHSSNRPPVRETIPLQELGCCHNSLQNDHLCGLHAAGRGARAVVAHPGRGQGDLDEECFGPALPRRPCAALRRQGARRWSNLAEREAAGERPRPLGCGGRALPVARVGGSRRGWRGCGGEARRCRQAQDRKGRLALEARQGECLTSSHPRFNLPFCNVVIECNFESQSVLAWTWRCQCCTLMWVVSSTWGTHFVISISTWQLICQLNWHSTEDTTHGDRVMCRMLVFGVLCGFFLGSELKCSFTQEFSEVCLVRLVAAFPIGVLAMK